MLLPFGDQRTARTWAHKISKRTVKCHQEFEEFKREMREAQTTLLLRVSRMKCQRLAKESQVILKKIFQDYKNGLQKLGTLMQYCDTGPIHDVPPLLFQQYNSFKKLMERSQKLSEEALAVAADATAREHRLFERLNIPLEFNFF